MVPGLVFTIEPRFVNAHGIFNCEERESRPRPRCSAISGAWTT